MKYAILISFLFLTACGSGFEISRKTHPGECLQKAPDKISWICEHTSNFIFDDDVTLAECETEKECRDICDKARAENAR